MSPGLPGAGAAAAAVGGGVGSGLTPLSGGVFARAGDCVAGAVGTAGASKVVVLTTAGT